MKNVKDVPAIIVTITALMIIAAFMLGAFKEEKKDNVLYFNEPAFYTFNELREKYDIFISDDTLIERTFDGDKSGSIKVYSEDPVLCGESNSRVWVTFKTDNGIEIVLQDESLSRPIYISRDKDTVYVLGETVGFSTNSGINIMKYTIGKECITVENAIDMKDCSKYGFMVNKDSLNKNLFSLIPCSADGIGRAYFDEINDLSVVSAVILEENDEKYIRLRRNNAGIYKFIQERNLNIV